MCDRKCSIYYVLKMSVKTWDSDSCCFAYGSTLCLCLTYYLIYNIQVRLGRWKLQQDLEFLIFSLFESKNIEFWSFNSIYMLLFQFVTFIRGSKMSVKAAQFSLLSSAVLLGLWSTRIDLSDLLYMTSNRSVCWTTEKRREVNVKMCDIFCTQWINHGQYLLYYCVHQAIFIGNIGSVP